jgi:hypothetical protein
MSTNCSVTKLKGTVDNDNLPFLNSIVFRVPSGFSATPCSVCVQNNKNGAAPTTLEIIKGTGLLTNFTQTTSGQFFTYPAINNASCRITTETEILLKASNIYDIGDIYGIFMIDNVPLEIVSMSVSSLEELINNSDNVRAIIGVKGGHVFDINKFTDAEKPTLDTINCNTKNGTIKGDIQKLGCFTGLTNLRIWESTENYRLVHGDIVNFINKQKSNGRTSAIIAAKWLSQTNVKFHDATPITADQGSIEWTDDYMILRDSGLKVIQSYGASTAQISAWENDGYTVTQV